MDPVTVGYVAYKIWKWLKGKPDSSTNEETDTSSGDELDDTVDDIMDVII